MVRRKERMRREREGVVGMDDMVRSEKGGCEVEWFCVFLLFFF